MTPAVMQALAAVQPPAGDVRNVLDAAPVPLGDVFGQHLDRQYLEAAVLYAEDVGRPRVAHDGASGGPIGL